MIQKIRNRLHNDKKYRRKLLLVGVLFLGLLGAGLFTLIRPAMARETYVYKEETVSRGDLVLGITESGSLTFTQKQVDYDLALSLIYEEDEEEDEDDEEEEESSRYLEVEEVYAVSGQRVEKGDPLFSLTKDSISAVRRKISAALSEVQISLSTAQTEYQTSMISAKSTYDSNVEKGKNAKTQYQASLNQSSAKIQGIEGEIDLLSLEITQAQEKLSDEDFLEEISDAQNEYTAAKNILDDTDVHNAAAYVSNLSDYEEAKEALNQLLEQKETYESTITENQAEIEKKQKELQDAYVSQVLQDKQAENDYESALLSGELAGDIYDYSTQSLDNEVTAAQNTCEELQQLMDDFEEFVGSDGVVYAPENGLVISVDCEEGDELTKESTLITYTTQEDTITIDVSEEDVSAIAVGNSVDIVFTAYPEETYKGTVASITTTSSSDYASTISYPVVISVEGNTDLLYGGMTADVTFVTDSVSDVLYVSKKAVFEENGKTCVYRKAENGEMEITEVETGFADMSSIEIKEGLLEGDTVYLKSLMSAEEE